MAKSQSLSEADGGQAQTDAPERSKVKAVISGDPTTDACLAPEMPGYSRDTEKALPAGKVYGQQRPAPVPEVSSERVLGRAQGHITSEAQGLADRVVYGGS